MKSELLVPCGSFLLAVVLSFGFHPSARGMALRPPQGETDCTPGPATITPVKAVDQKAFAQDEKHFDPAKPPKNMPPLNPGEAGLTDFQMDSKVKSNFDYKTCKTRDQCKAIAYLTTLTVTLNGKATVWLPNGASPLLIAHEAGHVEICRQMYDATGTKLKADIPKAPDKSGVHTAPACEAARAAAKAELDKAINKFVDDEMTACNDANNKANDSYDGKTSQGTEGDQDKEAKDAAAQGVKALLGG